MKTRKQGLKLPRYTQERANASCCSMTTFQASKEHLDALKARIAAKKAFERPAYV